MTTATARQWVIVSMLPKAPRRIDAAGIEVLLRKRGMAIHRRTIQRDLMELSALFPIVCDERTKPYGWRWSEDAEFMCTLPARPDAPPERDLEVRIRVRKVALRSMLERLRAEPSRIDDTSSASHVEVLAKVGDDCATRRVLLGHADEVEVLEPDSLRAEIAARAQRASTLHAR